MKHMFMNEMAVRSIRHQADERLKQFRLLLKVEEEVKGNDMAAAAEANELRTEDQLARFEMWAGNIGVFADGHASLDYRLRDHDDARRMMSNFLDTLGEFLGRAIEEIKPYHTVAESSGIAFAANTDDANSANDIYSTSLSSAPTSSFQGTELESTTGDLSIIATPFDQKLQGVDRTIDRLYRLSLWIRQPSMSNQNLKAMKFSIVNEDGVDISKEFSEFAFQFVQHTIPEASRKLKIRLANGIVDRRKRFLYRQSHQKKLSIKTVMTVEPTDEESAMPDAELDETVRGVAVIADRTSQPQKPLNPGASPPHLPSQTSASAMNKSPIPVDKVIDDEESKQSTTFSTTATTNIQLSIPDPPKPCPGSKEFECPYCCMVLPISKAKAYRWRRHVLDDLEPYACVFENCQEEQAFFRDRTSWSAHMRNTHTVQWVCTSAAHGRCSFSTEVEFCNHMWETHEGTFTKAQLPLLSSRSKAPTLATFRECPLCGFRPLEDRLLSEIQARRLQQTSKEMDRVASDHIMKHVARHLEALSLKALPWQDSDSVEDALSEGGQMKGDDDEEDTNQSENNSHDLSKAYSSLTLSAMGMENAALDEWIEAETLAVMDPKASYDEEWGGFIPRPDYFGHVRDPVLQPLLRKLYLDASPVGGGTKFKGPKLPAYLVSVDRDQGFYGRDHVIKIIEDALVSDPVPINPTGKPVNYPRCFVVYGPGGMGKTQLSAHFVSTHRHDFDAILWVNSENASKISQAFKDIAIFLGLVSENSVDASDLLFTRDIVKRWLVNPWKNLGTSDHTKHGQKASWLLVFDGVEDGELLDEFWPYDGPGSILITSRNSHSWSASLELKPFTAKESSDYLFHVAGRNLRDEPEEEKKSALEIARHLGGFPLALAQMGKFIVHRSMSFTEFLKQFEERERKQELLQWSHVEARPRMSMYEHNLASVWAFDSLGKGSKLLNVLSMMDPDGVPESIFKALPNEKDTAEVAELKRDYKEARTELLARSLVSGNSREKKLFVHRLVQEVARTRMGYTQLREVLFTALRLIASIWPFEVLSWRHGIKRWAACEELFPHVQRLKDLFPGISPSVDSFEDYELAKLLIDAGWYRHERGHSSDAIMMNNMAQSICESMKLRALEHPELVPNQSSILPQINYSLVEINHNRGCIALEINEPVDALKYLKSFNSMMIKELAGSILHDDMRLAISWNELGNAYMLNENWSKGEECFLKSIEEMKRLNGFTPVLISLPHANLGLAFWLQGKLEQAEETLVWGLQEREKQYGVDDRISFITGRFLHALGNVKGSQGDQESAFHYHRRTLLHYKSTLGNRHHRTADLFVKIAEHNVMLHQHDMALALLDHALETYTNLNQFMPEKVRALWFKSKALRGLGRPDDAAAELSRCFKLYDSVCVELCRKKRMEVSLKKRDVDLTDEDVDALVAFWSK